MNKAITFCLSIIALAVMSDFSNPDLGYLKVETTPSMYLERHNADTSIFNATLKNCVIK